MRNGAGGRSDKLYLHDNPKGLCLLATNNLYQSSPAGRDTSTFFVASGDAGEFSGDIKTLCPLNNILLGDFPLALFALI